MKRYIPHAFLAASAFGLTLLAGPALAQQPNVSLTLKDGRVTLKTVNATVRQILEEWSRVGQAKVVNAEKLIGGPPLTLTLEGVTEREALEIILRQAAGYMAIDRSGPAVVNASRYERIMVLATRTAPATASAQNGRTPRGPAPVTETAVYSPVEPPEPSSTEPEPDELAGNMEPPQPNAPVINPYMATAPGQPGVAGNGSQVNVQPPEVTFDYANPQAYFERQRQLQLQQQGADVNTPTPSPTGVQGGAFGTVTPPPASGFPGAAPQQPATSSQPGLPPVQPSTVPGGNMPPNFNPYNLPPDYRPGQTGNTPNQQIEPDRSKYMNPYVAGQQPPKQP